MDARDLPTPGAGTDDRSGVPVPRAPERSDEAIRRDLLRLVECYSGEPGSWAAEVRDGTATIRRVHGRPATTAEQERLTVRALGHSVAGVVAIRVVDGPARGRTAAVPMTA